MNSKSMPAIRSGYWVRWASIVIVICTGMALSIMMFSEMRNGQSHGIRVTFEFDSENRIAAIKRSIQSDLWLIQAVGAFYAGSYEVERQEFHDFVSPFLLCHPGVQAIEWVKRVPGPLRATYEEAVRQDGFPGFQITERMDQGRIVPAGQRDQYYPVYFVEPYQGNELALGFDIASDFTRKEALSLARDTGGMIATGPLTFVQETKCQLAFLICLPVYRKDVQPDCIEARRQGLQGFVLGVFRVDDIVEQALSNLNPEDIDISLYDRSPSGEERSLYYHPSKLHKASAGSFQGVAADSGMALRYDRTLTVAGREWHIICSATPDYIASRQSFAPWGLLLGGLFFTSILAVYFVTNMGRTARIERLVQDRTGELSVTNEVLEREIALREQREKELQEAYDEMEKRVEERTAELENINNELEIEITERKKSEEKFRLLVENLPNIVYRGFMDWSVQFTDNKIEQLTGYGMDEFNSGGVKWSDLIIEEDLETARQGFSTALKEGKPYVREFRIKTKSGDILWIQDRGRIVRREREDHYITGIFFDITDRKRADQVLRERDETLRAILAASPVGIGFLRNGIFDWGNKTLCRMVGYEEGGLSCMSSRIFYTDNEEYERVNHRLYAGIGEKGTGEIELKWVAKDGGIIDCYLHASALDPSDFSKGLIVALTDVTEVKRQADQLRQAQKMEAIGTLAGGIAHDFNNILGIILGYTEMTMYDASLEVGSRLHLQKILEATYRARDLVSQILAFSRQSETKRMAVQVAPLVKEALKLLRPSLPTTLEIRQSIRAPLSSVLADPVQIHQVLMNLCTNAAHAMRGRTGILEIELVDVEFIPENLPAHPDLHPGRYLRLTVSDTGHGMDRATMDRIFDPYFTTKKPGEGTGLGLAVVHGIVKGCGGAILVGSEPGKGTTFHIFMPRIESREPGKIEPPHETPSMGSERILLVDDEEALVDIGKKILEHLGYKVTTRTSSIEALEAFRAKPGQFDLVITDMTMPNMTGVELARELMRIQPDIPIVLCTGFSELMSVDEAKAMGIRELVMKPLVLAETAHTVRLVLDSGNRHYRE